MLLTHGSNAWLFDGAPLTSSYLFFDSFQRSDGSVGNGWTDAIDVWGSSQFDAVNITDELLTVQPSHAVSGSPTYLVGRGLIARDLGISDNFEVTVRWWLSDDGNITVSRALQQVSPVAFVDLEADEPLEMGVMPVWDISIAPAGATYIQNLFRSPIADYLNPVYYTLLGGQQGGAPPATRGFYYQNITLRCVNGTITYLWDRTQVGSSIQVPSWAQGRTWFGVNIAGIDFSGTYPGGAPVLGPTPTNAVDFRVKQL